MINLRIIHFHIIKTTIIRFKQKIYDEFLAPENGVSGKKSTT